MKKVGIVLIVMSVIFFGLGIYKYAVYVDDDWSFQEPKNYYVGGDAYNYIINSNYFSGYSALASGTLISGVILIVASALLEAKAGSESNHKEEDEDYSNIYMYYCHECDKVFSLAGSAVNMKCPNCGTKFIKTGYPKSKWIALSDSDKEKMKNDWSLM